MAAFSSASDTAGLVLCAGVLIRLRDRSREPGLIEVFRRVLAFRRVTSLMAMAATCTFVRLVRIVVRKCWMGGMGLVWLIRMFNRSFLMKFDLSP